MSGLEDLAGVPNVPAVIERIDNAATKATMLMRATGMSLSRRRNLVPTLDEVDAAIRHLVVMAAEDCFHAQEVAKQKELDEPIFIESAQGVAEDDLFRVGAAVDSNGELTVDILFRLV